MDPSAPEHYVNRELSWLEFNRRVLALAQNSKLPLLERLKFVSIAASNLDEFVMVRIGGLEREAQEGGDLFEPGPDGIDLASLLLHVHMGARELSRDLAQTLEREVLPALADAGITIVRGQDLSDEDVRALSPYYHREVHPCLTPIAIDPVHPFPLLKNGSLNLALRVEASKDAAPRTFGFETRQDELLALVQVPSVLPRFVHVPGKGQRFAMLEHIIARFAGELFPGHTIAEACAFRLTRASDLDLDEDRADNLLTSIQEKLRRRDRGEPVRLEIANASEHLEETLTALLDVREGQIFSDGSFVDPASFMKLYGRLRKADFKDPPFNPTPSEALRFQPIVARAIAERDVAAHHVRQSRGPRSAESAMPRTAWG